MNILVPLALAAVLSVMNWFSELYSDALGKFHSKIVSFSAGLFITYIFLFMFPEIFKGSQLIGESVFFFVLFGFVIFHILEKYIYQHVTDKKLLLYELSELHIGGFFADQFLVGILLFISFSKGQDILSYFIFLPLLLHTVSSSISLTQIDTHINQNKIIMFILAAAPFFGALTAFLLVLGPENYILLLSFVVGAMLYTVIRDAMPRGKEGNINFFLFGLCLSLLLLVLAGVYSIYR